MPGYGFGVRVDEAGHCANPGAYLGHWPRMPSPWVRAASPHAPSACASRRAAWPPSGPTRATYRAMLR